MAITSFAPSPTMKQKQLNAQLNSQRIQNAKAQSGLELAEQQNEQTQANNAQLEYSSWNAFLRVPEPQDIKIEFPLTVKAEPENAVAVLQKQEQVQEDRIDYDIAEVLEAEQTLNQSRELSATGTLPFNSENLNIGRDASASQKSENQSNNEFVETLPIETETVDVLTSADTLTVPETEPLIEDEHTQQPQEFTENVDLVRHHPDFDPVYFFEWLGSQFEPAGKLLDKTILNAKQWMDTKTAVIDDLLLKQIFGFGTQKKELTPEEKAQQQTRVTNKRSFFDSLRSGMARVINPDRQRNLRTRVESLNKSLKRGNLSYEGDLDASGQIRESSLIEEELANSKKSEQQLLDEKRKKMMMAGKAKAKSGPGITMSADKSHNFNNAAKLAG